MKKELIINKLPTDFCHASTLAAVGGVQGIEALACWFGGSHEGADDVGIYLSACRQGQWSEPELVVSTQEPCWNPVLYLHGAEAAGQRVSLFYKQGRAIADWRTYVLTLTLKQGEVLCSEPHELVDGDVSGGRGPVRNKLLRLRNGRLLAGGSVERGIWTAFADISDDDGRTWQKSTTIAIDGLTYNAGEKTAESAIEVSQQSFFGRGVIQPSLWQSADGSVHMLLRSSEGYVYRSDSQDNGANWCAAYPTQIPNNNSGLDLVQDAAGRLFLVCNPVEANWGRRSPLSLFVSQDDGASWQRVLDLESGEGEYSYPAIICHDNRLEISYTYNRRNIAHVICDINELDLFIK